MVEKLFWRIFKAGPVQLGQESTEICEFTLMTADQHTFRASIFSYEAEAGPNQDRLPLLVTQHGCKEIGVLIIDHLPLPVVDQERSIQVKFFTTETGIRATATVIVTKHDTDDRDIDGDADGASGDDGDDEVCGYDPSFLLSCLYRSDICGGGGGGKEYTDKQNNKKSSKSANKKKNKKKKKIRKRRRKLLPTRNRSMRALHGILKHRHKRQPKKLPIVVQWVL